MEVVLERAHKILVFGGNALIYENGRLIASGKRFSLESQLITTQIDVEMLRNERRDNTTYINAQRSSELGIEQIDIIPCFEREINVFALEEQLIHILLYQQVKVKIKALAIY